MPAVSQISGAAPTVVEVGVAIMEEMGVADVIMGVVVEAIMIEGECSVWNCISSPHVVLHLVSRASPGLPCLTLVSHCFPRLT